MSRRLRITLSVLIVLALLGFVAIGDWLSSTGRDNDRNGDRGTEAAATRGENNLAALENKARNEPGKALNFIRLGEAYKASGRLGEAVSAYVSAAELAPGDTEVQRALVSLRAMAEAKGRH